MRRIKRTVLSIVLICSMLLVSGCGKDFDAQGLVQSYMDLITKGETGAYCRITGATAEEAADTYQELLNGLKDAFAAYDGISEDTKQALSDAYALVLSKADYDVHEAVKVDDKYQVSMDIKPIQGAFKGIDELAGVELMNKISENPDMSEGEMYDFLFSGMADLMVSNVNDLTYGEPQTVNMLVAKVDDVYAIEDEESIGELVGKYLIDTSEFDE